MLLSCPVSGKPCMQTKSSHPLLINIHKDKKNITYFPCMCLFYVGLQADDNRPEIHMQSLHNILCKPNKLLQILPTAKPCSATSFSFVLLPSEAIIQVDSLSLPSQDLCTLPGGWSEQGPSPFPSNHHCSPAWKCLSHQGTSRLHICLEDHPVCVRVKPTLKFIQFFFPVTHPPLLPQLRPICHINPFNLGKFQVQFLLLHSIPASGFTLCTRQSPYLAKQR